MSAVGDLLPRSSTAFEKALAAGMSDALPVPLRQMMDPATTPAQFLPWLAAHQSVDLWYSDWLTARKRLMIANAIRLARIKGTRQAAIDFLAYVDAEILDVISYPRPFVLGRGVLGRTPIGHKAFVARYLVRTSTVKPPRALVAGRGVLGRHPVKTPSREPILRALHALRVAKTPETQVRADFAHHRPLTLGDAPLLDGSHFLGEYVPRFKL